MVRRKAKGLSELLLLAMKILIAENADHKSYYQHRKNREADCDRVTDKVDGEKFVITLVARECRDHHASKHEQRTHHVERTLCNKMRDAFQ